MEQTYTMLLQLVFGISKGKQFRNRGNFQFSDVRRESERMVVG